jgi:hypothetical protein
VVTETRVTKGGGGAFRRPGEEESWWSARGGRERGSRPHRVEIAWIAKYLYKSPECEEPSGMWRTD